jgi:Protein of unknown function (DUF1553)/Protein of unknown function (DUF1549)
MITRYILLIALWLGASHADADFTVLPSAISLTGQGASSSVLVQAVEDRGANSRVNRVGAQLSQFSLSVADPAIAEIVNGRVVAKSDGGTELQVSVAGESRIARIPITVTGAVGPQPLQFTAHVEAILARQGCNSGACHGALAGKGGFKLSLLGYDPQADHFTMTSQDQARRIEPSDVAASLLLAKPSMDLPHKGGLKLDKDSADYRLIAQWIAAGSPGPSRQDARLLGIELFPSNLTLPLEQQQQLLVRARYEDGRMEDVTHWTRFSSSNENVAEINEAGQIKVVGQGRGAIVAWFGSRIAIANVDVPYSVLFESKDESLAPRASFDWAAEREKAWQQFRPSNVIDEILLNEWRALGLAPSPQCDDATFLRRAYLDATGTLPTPEAISEFLADQQSDKRAKVVEHLLAGPAYVDYWSYKWSDLLLVNGNLLRPEAVKAFYQWIRTQVQNNTPWDDFARQIILARGDSVKDGATNFYAIHQSPEAMVENTCLAFMGLSIECAKCHNHPLERWTNDQYYAMANLFSRVRAKGWGGDARSGDGKRTLVVLERGELIQPSRGKPQLPAPLDQPALDPDATGDRRLPLAEWLTSPRNSYFARAIVNRVWANYMGVGLVESVDDLRTSNPPCSERLMQTLADHLQENRYDLKSLMRLIMTSRAYQLSAEATPLNAADKRFYCRYYPRRLMAEVLHDAMVSVTGVPTTFDKIEFSGADKQPTDFYPQGTKALALYDSAVSNYFLQAFGRNQRRITCECERSAQPTVVQVLHLSNGTTVNEKLASESCIIKQWLDSNLTDQQIVQQAYLRALSRPPTEAEQVRVWQALAEASQTVQVGGKAVATADSVPAPPAQELSTEAKAVRREILEDLLWSLMSSSEFLFAH